MKKIISLAMASALAASSLIVAAPQAEARPGMRHGHVGKHYVARRHGRRNAAAGAAVAGIAGALIGGAIAANSARHYGYYDDPGYGYGPAPAYGYGYAPGGYYGY